MKLPGTATQPENIYIAMGKLSPEKDMVFLDVGCGSGAVSLAASRLTDDIFGVDLRPEAVEASRKLVPRGTFLLGDVTTLLPQIPEIDRCFIGGTRGIESFLPLILERAAPGFVVVANLARVKIASRVVELMKELSIFQEMLMIEIHRGKELGGDIALRPINPIFMVVGRC